MDKNKIEKLDITKTDWKSSREFFQSLEDELRDLDDKDERYDFTWVGRRKSIIEAGSPINKTLRPDIESSKNWETTENLYIEGDNLDALKLLQEPYLGKVRMIYIDPPYNTGNDFVYHDDFKKSTVDYNEAIEYKDNEGNIQFIRNEKSNGQYHSDWLSMMYPRLKLCRNMLINEGVIFVSIGEEELANLKLLMDEIFGAENYLSTVTRIAKSASDKGNYFAPSTDYILVYSREISSTPFFHDKVDESLYKKTELTGNRKGEKYRDDVALYQSGLIGQRPNCRYYLTAPDGQKIIPPVGKFWRWSPERWKQNEDLLVFKKTNSSPLLDDTEKRANWNVYVKSYLKDRQETGTKPRNFITDFINRKGADYLKKLGIPFDYAKPFELIQWLISIVNVKPNDIILDFFSGSASTAQAVMQLNSEDGGNRKFIMVQLPELTEETSAAYKAGYKNICEIGRERIRRAGDKIAKEHPEAKVDYGFRSLVIADTNYKEVNKAVEKIGQAQILETIDNIKEDRSPLDLLFGVLTQLALELNRPLETREIDGNPVYLYDYLGEVSGLAACFSESISEESIKSIAKLKPLVAVFKDSSFPDSQAKINLSEHFKVLSPDTKLKVI